MYRSLTKFSALLMIIGVLSIETPDFKESTLRNPIMTCSKSIYTPMMNPRMTCFSDANSTLDLTWTFKSNNGSIFQEIETSEPATKIGKLIWISFDTPLTTSGILTCEACSNGRCTNASCDIFVSADKEIQIISSKSLVTIGDKLELVCNTSNYNCDTEVTWRYSNNSELILSDRLNIKETKSWTEYRSILTIDPVEESDQDIYFCHAKCQKEYNARKETVNYNLTVLKPVSPYFVNTNMNSTESIYSLETTQSIVLKCYVSGIPIPTVSWWKDNNKLVPKKSETGKCGFIFLNESQELHINNLDVQCSGEYKCVGENRLNRIESSLQKINISSSSFFKIILISTVIFAIGCLITGIYLWMQKRRLDSILKEKELIETGLVNFKEGALDSLNPELTVDEQIDFLPYDSKWEFSKDKLKLGKQLGSGEFGVVMRAEAEGICEGESVTTVAVKMLRRTAEPMHIKTLANELKILSHLGKHLNVVNLLGAVTKNIHKRELQIIVEYCHYGNLKNYLMINRSEFNSEIESARKKNASPNKDAGSETDLQEVIVSVEPSFGSNYCGDCEDRNAKTIDTRDLMSWSFQVASGMDYLCQRNVFHGDLAARNVLLSENNVVKICDFGLSKTMYKYENYKKESDTPLPFKWMAIESLRDGIFSTQSDIWSFGIVLWELFTLAQTPYTGMDSSIQFAKLTEGYRLEKPELASQTIYDIMLECWKTEPRSRPSFSTLVKKIGDLLDVKVREDLENLNDPYVNMNRQRLEEGQCDYLTMLSAPDHGALSSPSRNDEYLPMTRRNSSVIHVS